jgi:hypothetical protein
MNVVVPRYRPSVFSYLGLRGDGWLDFTSCGSCYSRLLFPTSLSSQVLFSFVLAPFKSITWVCVFKLEGLLHHDPVLDRHSWSLFYSLGPFLLTIEFFLIEWIVWIINRLKSVGWFPTRTNFFFIVCLLLDWKIDPEKNSHPSEILSSIPHFFIVGSQNDFHYNFISSIDIFSFLTLDGCNHLFLFTYPHDCVIRRSHRCQPSPLL